MAKTNNALVTYTDLTTMGLTAIGTPATGNRIATKEFIVVNYDVDLASLSTFANLECPPYQYVLPALPPCYIPQGYVDEADLNASYNFEVCFDYYSCIVGNTTYCTIGSGGFTLGTDCWQPDNGYLAYYYEYSGGPKVPASASYLDGYNPCITTTTTTTAYIPVTGLVWSTTSSATGVPSCQPSGWIISNQNLTIRYNVANSLNCGGTCNITQTGVATATITVGGVNTYLGLNFNGIGERQDANFEKIKFTLNGGVYSNVELARANAAGGGLGCAVGPVVKTYLLSPPYLLVANTVYTFTIDFTTNDNKFHVGAYYEVLLSFT